MKKKWLALALAGMLSIAPALGLAESVEDFDPSQVQPLLDAVTSAALGAEETVETLGEDTAVTEDFLIRLLKALKDYGIEADADTLNHLIAMPLSTGNASAEAAVELLTLRVLTADVSEAGDAVMLIGEVVDNSGQALPEAGQVVIELRADAASPVGWKLYRFTLNDSALLEAVTESYLAGLTVEYINTAFGYSIQYPAIFPQEQITEIPTGIQAALADDSASFSVSRLDNANSLTLDALLEQEQAMNPGTEIFVNEITGSGFSVFHDETVTHIAIYLVSDAYIYQAELNYLSALEEEFAQYAQYMLNSFSADELGLG